VPDNELERAKAALVAAAKSYLIATKNTVGIVPIDAHRFAMLGDLESIRGMINALAP
jgi:hypothetical protein